MKAAGSLTIRDYRPADERAWLDCWGRVAVTSHAWGAPPYQAKPHYARRAVELVAVAGGDTGPAVEVSDGSIVGFIDVEIEEEPGDLGLLTDSPCGFAWEFGVLEAYRRRGLGRRLVETAAERLKAAGVRRMEFWSMDEKAQRFYAAVGMRVINRHWRFWTRGGRGLGAALSPDEPVSSLAVELVHATASEDDWAKVREKCRVIETPPLEPHLCLGFDYRF